MSDLAELRQRLNLDLERVMGAAAIADSDNEAMREAILDALEIYDEARGKAQADRAAAGEMTPGILADAMLVNAATREAKAARDMAARLRDLTRVYISAVPLADPGEIPL